MCRDVAIVDANHPVLGVSRQITCRDVAIVDANHPVLGVSRHFSCRDVAVVPYFVALR